MTARLCLSALRRLALLAVVAFCLWQGYEAVSPYFRSRDAYSYYESWRAAARSAPEGSIALLCGDSGSVNPVDRSRLIAMSWERSPDAPAVVDAFSGLQDFDAVLSSTWVSNPVAAKLESAGFSVASSNEYVKTWTRGGCSARERRISDDNVPLLRDLAALALELVIALSVFALVSKRRFPGGWTFAVALAVALVLGAVALSHPLLAPNGLGVYGGKAKLLFECGSFPGGFWTDPRYSVFQPSYPPGLTFVAWLHFALSGGCGDRLVQLTVVFATAVLCLLMARGSRSRQDALAAAVFCLSPIAVRMSAGFYAEPFAALTLLCGWNMAADGRRISGAFAMGLAALFRLEAGPVAFLFAAGACAFAEVRRERIAMLAASAAPAFAWFAFCAAAGGGGPSDWDFSKAPQFGQVAYAALCEAKALGMFVLPAAALSIFKPPLNRPRLSAAPVPSLAPTAVLLIAIPAVCAFHDSPHARWMIDNTVPRLVWYISAIPLFGKAQRRS